MNVIVTDHARKRLTQRVHKNWQKAADEAWVNGVGRRQLKGSFRRYVDSLADSRRPGRATVSSYKIYNDNIYLFTPNMVLVTVLHVPTKYIKVARQIQGNTTVSG